MHPLQLVIQEMKQLDRTCAIQGSRQGRMHQVHLGPLEVKDIAAMVSDSFRSEPSAADGLAHLLAQKCHGNPFFVVQSLTNFHRDKLLWFEFDASVLPTELSPLSQPMSPRATTSRTRSGWQPHASQGGCWKWDLEALWAADIGSNVVDLLSGNIKKLERHLQAILKVASCLGNCFTLHRLSVATARSLDDLVVDVWTLVELDLLIASGKVHELATLAADRQLSLDAAYTKTPSQLPGVEQDGEIVAAQLLDESVRAREQLLLLRFTHDGVQAAAYALLTPLERRRTHATIARLLLQSTPARDLDQVLIEVVEHLDTAGLEGVASEDELRTVIALNLQAGQKAKNNTAWQPANKYLSFGVAALKALQLTTTATMVVLERCRSDTAPRDGEVGFLEMQDVVSRQTSFADSTTEEHIDGEACWRRDYTLSLSVHRELIEVAFLTSEFERAEQFIAVCLRYTTESGRDIMDQIGIHELLMASQSVHSNQMEASVATGLRILDLLGVQLASLTPQLSDMIERDADALSLRHLPDNRDARALCVARTLNALAPNAYLVARSRPTLAGDVAATLYVHTLEHGGSGLVGIGWGVLFVLHHSTPWHIRRRLGWVFCAHCGVVVVRVCAL